MTLNQKKKQMCLSSEMKEKEYLPVAKLKKPEKSKNLGLERQKDGKSRET